MGTVDHFRRMFSGVSLELEDLFLLEPFQISYLPGWVPEESFTCVLKANPGIATFLKKKYPPIAEFVEKVMQKYPSAAAELNVDECADRLLWTIADLLVYNRYPEVYDSLAFHNWDFSEITSLTPLEGRTVIDAGAGTGRVALEAARSAMAVFAVEPVPRLRRFIMEKAGSSGLSNVYAADGFLHSIPYPDSFADVLITSHALGWKLESELPEFERVVKPGGFIIHCPGTLAADNSGNIHEKLISWGYSFSNYFETDGEKRKYWKELPLDSCITSSGQI
jgi:ubiquinone/menaquinone biosynthesis C-methylase UbiE